MFWLKHPEHGEMVVYGMADVERHQKWGWALLNEGNAPVRVKPSPALQDGDVVTFASSAPVHDIAVPAGEPVVVSIPARKKPGPKPKAK